MAARPPGCWHKSNGSRYTSPQNRLYPPPGEPGTVYGQLITTKTGPARPAQWAPPPGIRPHGSPQRHNTTKFDGGEIVRNAEENRLQILFDEIPDADTRDALKSNGFRWSPRNKAWQRQLTQNAEYAARRVLGL